MGQAVGNRYGLYSTKLAGFSESATNNLSERRLSLKVKSLVIQCREILAVINSFLSERHLSLEVNSLVIQCRKRVSYVYIDLQTAHCPTTHAYTQSHAQLTTPSTEVPN